MSNLTSKSNESAIGKRLRVILEVLSKDESNEGLSWNKLMQLTKLSDMRVLENNLKILESLNAIKYKDKKPRDRHYRVSISDIGIIIYTGEITLKPMKIPLTNDDFKKFLNELSNYFTDYHSLQIINEGQYKITKTAISTIEKNLEKDGLEESIFTAVNELQKILTHIKEIQKLSSPGGYDRFMEAVDNLNEYYHNKIISYKRKEKKYPKRISIDTKY